MSSSLSNRVHKWWILFFKKIQVNLVLNRRKTIIKWQTTKAEKWNWVKHRKNMPAMSMCSICLLFSYVVLFFRLYIFSDCHIFFSFYFFQFFGFVMHYNNRKYASECRFFICFCFVLCVCCVFCNKKNAQIQILSWTVESWINFNMTQ